MRRMLLGRRSCERWQQILERGMVYLVVAVAQKRFLRWVITLQQQQQLLLPLECWWVGQAMGREVQLEVV